MAMVISMTLAAIAIPSYGRIREQVRVTKATNDIRSIELSIQTFLASRGQLPNALAELPEAVPLDPWGNPYRFLNFAGAQGFGLQRKDGFLVPINSTYDLYSMGPDGRSRPPLTAKDSRDDIVRAGDGAYIGQADQY